MSELTNLVGERFGLLLVEQLSNNKHTDRIKWLCLCSCGKKVSVLSYNLKSGHTRSCGCLKTKHGYSSPCEKTGTYRTWLGIIQRCTNQKHKHYRLYGGRGITVCDRWKTFDYFLEDIGERPENCQIDRIDNDGGYYKENCRWVTCREQHRNKSTNRMIKFEGRTQCLTDWAEELGICSSTLRYRLDHWTVEESFRTLLADDVDDKNHDFYLAGGMRGYKDLNSPMFNMVAGLLRNKGFTVWNPAENEGSPGVSFASCMRLDLNAIINDCRNIAFLPGWKKSLGANIEAFVSFAVGYKGVEIVLNDDQTDFSFVDFNLGEYLLPYQIGHDRRKFNPHSCPVETPNIDKS